jgi:hypothetical protein
LIPAGYKVNEKLGIRQMVRLFRKILVLLLIYFLPSSAIAQSQDSMSQLLNQVDQPSVWQSTPVSGTGPAGSMSGGVSTGQPTNSAPFNERLPNTIAPVPAQNPFSTFQNILRTMMGSGGASAPGDVQSALNSAREDLQTARDQEAQARDACAAISGESDKGVKQGLAEQARYHAAAAREAADRAYEISGRFGSSDISGVASEARGAADAAQAAADRATARAEGGG